MDTRGVARCGAPESAKDASKEPYAEIILKTGSIPAVTVSSEVFVKMQMFYVVAEGSVEGARALIEAGVDPDMRDFEQRCPLHVAAARGDVPMIKLLVASGADVNAVDALGRSPMTCSHQSGSGFHRQVQKTLEDSGARKVSKTWLSRRSEQECWSLSHSDIDVGPELGRTMKSNLHRAKWRGTDVVVKMISTPAVEDHWSTSAGPELLEEAASPEQLEAELLQEISALAKLKHPDLVMFLGCCWESSPIMLVTEYLPGGDMERYYQFKRIENNGSRWVPALRMVARWARSIARGLAFMHRLAEPMIHRDLKPMNILLTCDLQAKIADLGASRSLRSRSFSVPDMDTPVSDATLMTRGVGTYRYMAPEVARGGVYSEKADIYAWGLVLYFMSSGLEPFHSYRDPERLLDDFGEGLEPRPSPSECPAQFRPPMSLAWHPDARCRPAAAELAEALADAGGQGGCACALM